MNLTDERAIYEWLYDDLRGRDVKLALCDRKGDLKPLPSLDMNTAFSECIPKLNAEGVHVLFGNFGSVMWFLDKMDDDSVYESPDFYAALLQYLEVA